MHELEVLVRGLTFPEGPRWHDGRLFFSDFYSHRVLAVDLAGSLEQVAVVDAQPSGLGWDRQGRLLIVSMLDRRLCRLEPDGALATVADLSAWAGGLCNDMVVDGLGRAWVGNFGFDRHKGEASATTVLVRVDPDGSVAQVADDVLFPNGAVITPDGRTLIVGETFRCRLTAWTITDDGRLTDRRVWADLEAGGHHPDGICLDAEGAIWVTDPTGGGVLRVHEGGHISATVRCAEPGRQAFAAMLGGADGRRLFVCTNTGSGPAMAERAEGRIEWIDVDVEGAGWP